MKCSKSAFVKVLLVSVFVFSIVHVAWSANETTPAPSVDSVNIHLDKATKALEKQDQDAAIAELMKAIKEQQSVIEQMKNAPAPASQYNASQESNDTFLKQLSRALPMIGGGYGDAEDQWRKAYKLQHKGVFDLSRKDAIPVFEQAIKEYRVVVEKYQASKRAPQAQRQIAWIFQSQLKDNTKENEEWN